MDSLSFGIVRSLFESLLCTRQLSPQPWKTAVRILPGVPAEALRAGAGRGEQLGKAWAVGLQCELFYTAAPLPLSSVGLQDYSDL